MDKKISTQELFVIKTPTSTDICIVYTSKSDAEEVCERLKEESYQYYRKIHKNMSDDEFEAYMKTWSPKHRVVTLYDAIDEVIDCIKDEYSSHGNPGY